MMLQIQNYTFTSQFYDSRETVMHRGYGHADKQPVVAKLPKSPYPGVRDLSKLRHEYSILQTLDIPGIIKAKALLPYRNSLALILEDVQGTALSTLIQEQPLELSVALRIASRLAEIIARLHRHGIIHKDIKPHNILVDEGLTHVHLIDFGISTRLAQENQKPSSPDSLEGTLAYMSPEQTGRMSRLVDVRSDIYSLGVTLYEMLTGSLPFTASEPIDLVHSHIARQPQAPHERRPEIPVAVSRVVLKMLAKAAEDRYQTGEGLKADLDRCLLQLAEHGRIEPFELGRHDQSAELRIPQKLYGREPELRELQAAFDRARKGAAELMLVAGYSGIGKSALVHEIQQSIARQHGYFISGKFDQLNRSVPYSGITQACRELLRQILTERTERLAHWRQRLQEAVGNNGGALSSLIPELSLIVGPSPSLPSVGPSEAQNRFSLVFQRFLQVFTTAEHPLVMFLDDLQWADAASLKLMQGILTDPERGHLLVIGAYRDNEVDAGHILSLTLDSLRQSDTVLRTIAVKALELPSVISLVAETVGQEPQQATRLAEAIFAKTQGNPFFVNQFMHGLHKARLLRFDASLGRWVWDEQGTREQMATDNVVAFMIERLKLLSAETQHTLRLAACIGFQFDLKTLAIIAERTPGEIADRLWSALRDGLVLPLDGDYRFIQRDDQSFGLDTESLVAQVRYRFLHDRVQQAAYSLIAEVERQQLHLRIGRLLLQSSGGDRDTEPSEESLFEIAQHLNLGSALITDQEERRRLARLNLRAAIKAKSAAAYIAAASYLSAGMSLLDSKAWQQDYDLCFAIYTERAECECMIGHFPLASSLFDELLPRLRTSRERAHVCNLRVILYTTLGNFVEAMRVGRAGLALYGIELPEKVEQMQAGFGAELAAVTTNLAGRRIEDLIHAPALLDPDKALSIQILANLSPSAYFNNPILYGVVILKQVNGSLKDGHTDMSALGYVGYGFLLAASMGRYAEAYEFGRLALALNEKFENKSLTSKLNSSFGGYLHFCIPMHQVLHYFEQAYREGMESGDFVYVSYASFAALLARLSMGDDLRAVAAECERASAIVQRTKDVLSTAHVLLCRQVVANLQGRTASKDTLSGDGYDEAAAHAELVKGHFIPVLCVHHLIKVVLAYLYEDYSAALAEAEAAERWCVGTLKTAFLTDLPFFYSLTLLARYTSATPEEQERSLEIVRRNRAELEQWAGGCRANYETRIVLIDAELKRIAQDDLGAALLYERAIELAQSHQDLMREALANELCAKFYLSRSRKKLATIHMTDAHYGYLHWGATTKAADIRAKHPTLILHTPVEPTPAATPVTVATTTGRSNRTSTVTTSTHLRTPALLDVSTVLNAAQALSQEIALDKVLEQVMRIVVTNAGARRGVLLLQRQDRLHIEALITIDPDSVRVLMNEPVDTSSNVPVSLVNYAARTRETLVLGDARREGRFADDPYIAAHGTKSVLCLCLSHQGRLTGVLYLENNVTADAFTAERVELLRLLSTQAASAVENSFLYEHVRSVTAELQQSNQELRVANERLQVELQERALAEQRQLALQNEIISFQSARLAELSTPLIPITDRIMVMPLIGVMDAQRANLVLETVLEGVQSHRTQVVIMDITGMKHVDTSVASTLINAASALRLLGAQAILTGIRAEVAQTLIGLGVDLSNLVTLSTLQSGIAYALNRSGESRMLGSGSGARTPPAKAPR